MLTLQSEDGEKCRLKEIKPHPYNTNIKTNDTKTKIINIIKPGTITNLSSLCPSPWGESQVVNPFGKFNIVGTCQILGGKGAPKGRGCFGKGTLPRFHRWQHIWEETRDPIQSGRIGRCFLGRGIFMI